MRIRLLPYLVLLSAGLQACAGNDAGKDATPRKDCVGSVLQLDSIKGGIRNKASLGSPLSSAIKDYVSAVDSFDFSNCPERFSTAFKNHLDAWKEMLPVTDKHAGLRGEMHDLFKQIEHSADSVAFRLRLKKVWDTWAEVEKAR